MKIYAVTVTFRAAFTDQERRALGVILGDTTGTGMASRAALKKWAARAARSGVEKATREVGEVLSGIGERRDGPEPEVDYLHGATREDILALDDEEAKSSKFDAAAERFREACEEASDEAVSHYPATDEEAGVDDGLGFGELMHSAVPLRPSPADADEEPEEAGEG